MLTLPRLMVGIVIAGSQPMAASGQTMVPVPPGPSVTLDGVVDSVEWQGASQARHENLRIRFQRTSEGLEIGMRTPGLFVASVCVERGNTVHVFHASSALGHAIYARADGGWDLVQGFEWRLRGDDPDPDAVVGHFERYGWVANTVGVGASGETEFRLAASYLDSSATTRVALGLLLEGDGNGVVGWPVEAEADGCTQRPTIAGPLPIRVVFDSARWAHLKVSRREGEIPRPAS